MQDFQVDVHKLPSMHTWRAIALCPGDSLTLDWDDLKAAFNFFRLPSGWRRCFAFDAKVSAVRHCHLLDLIVQFTWVLWWYPWAGVMQLALCSICTVDSYLAIVCLHLLHLNPMSVYRWIEKTG
eukprot:3864841-Amphidinium_carterae.1